MDATRFWMIAMRAAAALVLIFLILPIVAIIPLSFNAGSILAYPLQGFSLRWYAQIVSSDRWWSAAANSLIVAVATVAISTPLGTLAAVGLARIDFPGKTLLTALLISPMIVPVIITAVAIYMFFAAIGLANSLGGLVLAHTTLAVPFVLVTVSASLARLDETLLKAGASLGAGPLQVFGRITLPLIMPGIVSGSIFAFAASFDEVVIALMVTGPSQRTLPREFLSGARENLDPTIMAVATILILISTALLLTLTRLRDNKERAN